MTAETPKKPKTLRDKAVATEFAARPAGASASAGLKIRKIGNSLGVVLPKDVLAAMRVREGDMLVSTVTSDGQLTMKVQDADVDRLLKLADGIMERRRKVLRALAK